jgi:8-oxo-dGTP diphosphatase
MNDEDRPFIGVAAIIVKDGRVLLGKRIGKHGGGTWAPPGGKLEKGEEFEASVAREALEEAGLRVDVGKLLTVTNNIFKDEGKHSITLFFVCKIIEGSPKVMEPDKCEMWGWFKWEELPKPLFLPVEKMLKQNIDLPQ